MTAYPSCPCCGQTMQWAMQQFVCPPCLQKRRAAMRIVHQWTVERIQALSAGRYRYVSAGSFDMAVKMQKARDVRALLEASPEYHPEAVSP